MTMTGISSDERQLLAREIAADHRQRHMQREYSTDCPECDTTVWVYSASQAERAVFLEGWNAAMEYVQKERRVSSNVPNQEQANADSSLAD